MTPKYQQTTATSSALERIDSFGSMNSIDDKSTTSGVDDQASVATNTTTTSSSKESSSGTLLSFLTCCCCRIGGTNTTSLVLFMFGLILIMTSIGLCLTTAFVTLHWEEIAFHNDFNINAMKLLDHVTMQGQQHVTLIESLSKTIVLDTTTTTTPPTESTTVDDNNKHNNEKSDMLWPFVTVPSFEIQGSNIVELMNTSSSKVVFSPLVTAENREEWEVYTTTSGLEKDNNDVNATSKRIFTIDGEEDNKKREVIEATTGSGGPYLPVWQVAPTTTSSPSSSTGDTDNINFNLLSLPSVAKAFETVQTHGSSVISQPLSSTEVDLMHHLDLIPSDPDNDSNDDEANLREPTILLVSPVIYYDDDESTTTNKQMVGILVTPFVWATYLTNVFSTGSKGIEVVIQNHCGPTFTYQVNDKHAVYKGDEDLHTTYFDHLVQSMGVSDVLKTAVSGNDRQTFEESDLDCPYTMHVSPSAIFMNQHTTNHPVLATVFAVIFFSFIFIISLIYISYTQSQIEKQTKNATRTTKLVNALFPKEVQKRMFQEIEDKENIHSSFLKGDGKHSDPFSTAKAYMKENENQDNGGMPIADLWTACSVIFADIKGFTAWSACRSPSEVFHLLETLYGEFDKKAKRRGVFKVETIGDCYVAVTGLPNPRKDHAVIMTRFAWDCRDVMRTTLRKLEVKLGPETSDLDLRVGIHSGPVTAGVLRGEKGRFQLFGDTVNTASRMESHGLPGKIQVSEATAKLLIDAGKQLWLKPREELIEAKGIGCIQTYFVEPSVGTMASSSTSQSGAQSVMSSSDRYSAHGESKDLNAHLPVLDKKSERLVKWIVEMLSQYLQKVVHCRQVTKNIAIQGEYEVEGSINSGSDSSKKRMMRPHHRVKGTTTDTTVVDEFVETIDILLYQHDNEAPSNGKDHLLSPQVKKQLLLYVSNICHMYNEENPFHNFDHASHVTMSVVKLIQRVVAKTKPLSMSQQEWAKYDHSYGLVHDPLAQFACVFSAMIHDLDHPGYPNSQLVKENTYLAQKYHNKSIAEANSLDLAWDVLQQDQYKDLRHAIHSTEQEKYHFRQLLVNAVISTDIMDRDLKAIRESRWNKAFDNNNKSDDGRSPKSSSKNVKATIVMEYMIQASDVAHTMQHWDVFRKWNERLFMENYHAYVTGHADKDPSLTWFKSEIGFFDYYVIPLAKKLAECGSFGASSAEFVTYAESNKKEWIQKGERIVQNMKEKAQARHKMMENQ